MSLQSAGSNIASTYAVPPRRASVVGARPLQVTNNQHQRNKSRATAADDALLLDSSDASPESDGESEPSEASQSEDGFPSDGELPPDSGSLEQEVNKEIKTKIQDACTAHRQRLQGLVEAFNNQSLAFTLNHLANSACKTVTQYASFFGSFTRHRCLSPSNPRNAVPGYHRRVRKLRHEMCKEHVKGLRVHTQEICALLPTFISPTEPLDMEAVTVAVKFLLRELQDRLSKAHLSHIIRFQGLEDEYANLAEDLNSQEDTAVMTASRIQSPVPAISTPCGIQNITGTPCGPVCSGHIPSDFGEARLRAASNKLANSNKLRNCLKSPSIAPLGVHIPPELEAGIEITVRAFRTYSLAIDGRKMVATTRLESTTEGVKSSAEEYLSKLETHRQAVEQQLRFKMTTHADRLLVAVTAHVGIRSKPPPPDKFKDMVGHQKFGLVHGMRDALEKLWKSMLKMDEAFKERIETLEAGTSEPDVRAEFDRHQITDKIDNLFEMMDLVPGAGSFVQSAGSKRKAEQPAAPGIRPPAPATRSAPPATRSAPPPSAARPAAQASARRPSAPAQRPPAVAIRPAGAPTGWPVSSARPAVSPTRPGAPRMRPAVSTTAGVGVDDEEAAMNGYSGVRGNVNKRQRSA